MKAEFIKIDENQIQKLTSLANEIWHEYFPYIYNHEQIIYMLNRFYAIDVIQNQIQYHNYQYYYIIIEGKTIGFIGLSYKEERVFLSKLYLLKEYRKMGLASQALHFVEQLTLNHHKKYIYLTVDKHNDLAIHVFEKKGFVKIDTISNEIGQGYTLDRFIMEKVVIKKEISEKEKMIHGLYYMASDRYLKHLRFKAKETLYEYNDLHPAESDYERYSLLKSLLGKCGKKPYIEAPFHCDYGKNIRIGHYFYANTNCTILDSALVTIGDEVLLGPNVGLYTVNHPLDAYSRDKDYEIAKPITIGNHVWIGANAIVLAGVTIGDNSVIGAGSVVTHSIPANCLAVGNPCKVIRKIDQNQHVE